MFISRALTRHVRAELAPRANLTEFAIFCRFQEPELFQSAIQCLSSGRCLSCALSHGDCHFPAHDYASEAMGIPPRWADRAPHCSAAQRGLAASRPKGGAAAAAGVFRDRQLRTAARNHETRDNLDEGSRA